MAAPKWRWSLTLAESLTSSSRMGNLMGFEEKPAKVENVHPDPWRTWQDYIDDRNRMKWAMIASLASSGAAVIAAVAALIAVLR